MERETERGRGRGDASAVRPWEFLCVTASQGPRGESAVGRAAKMEMLCVRAARCGGRRARVASGDWNVTSVPEELNF